MDDENDADRLTDDTSSEVDSMDDGFAGVQTVSASSSDGVSVDDSVVSSDQVEDEQMNSDENSDVVSSARYMVSLFGLTFQMNSIPSDENTDEQSIEVPIEVAVFSRK
ncbi:unnamed protein product [Rotaria sp. Silwood1]|nr:unnamed protein product [Rotaria sp. Silwood1]CAF3357457.1 unnamed protein product [Rotaria sp. Silwood1]CAF4678131.1 unnamed protein product [Rotaria sp. Silwood1]